MEAPSLLQYDSWPSHDDVGFTRRPADALSKVAEFFLAEVDLPDAHRANIVQHLVFSHTHVVAEAARFAETLRRYYYVTPKNYLDYIQNYHSQLSYNEKKVGNSVKRLAGGLSKLVDAARDVDRMSIELKDAQVIVSAKTVEVEALIEQITEKTTIANKQKDEAEIMQAPTRRGSFNDRPYAIDARRFYQTRSWVVLFQILS